MFVFMSKRFLLLIVCLLGVFSSVRAQWSVSPEVGLSAFRGRSYEWRPAVKVGAAVDYQFKSNFSLESGLYYTQRGFVNYWVEDGPLGPESVQEMSSLVRHMLQVPLRARFTWEVADDVRVFVGAGPYLGLFFANDWKRWGDGGDYGRVAELGLSAMAGVEVKRFFVRLGFDLSFGDEQYHATTLSVGYRF